jgi:hypothetical protein
MIFRTIGRKPYLSQGFLLVILLICIISACSGGNGIEEPMAIDDKLIRVESVVPWTASEANENSESGTHVVPVLIVHTEIMAQELDSLESLDDWKVEIRNSQGATAPLLHKPDLVGYNPAEVKSDLIQASVDWYFEIDPASGPFTLVLPGNKQISLLTFLNAETE